jgi:hypothetical protein
MAHSLSPHNNRRLEGARVVILSGPRVWHRSSCATLIASGANVVGICVADQRSGGLPLHYIWKSVRRIGPLSVLSQIAGRALYRVLNGARDAAHLQELFDTATIDAVLGAWDGATCQAYDYGAPETRDWIAARRPDVLIVSTPYWVTKAARDLATMGLVIGGHPGITPHYRGSHSAFWALLRGRPDDVGYTVFHVSKGVDTGDVITQGRITIEPGDTYFSLAWKAGLLIAAAQAETLANLDRGIPVPRHPHATIPPDSEFGVPGLFDYLRYRMVQRLTR